MKNRKLMYAGIAAVAAALIILTVCLACCSPAGGKNAAPESSPGVTDIQPTNTPAPTPEPTEEPVETPAISPPASDPADPSSGSDIILNPTSPATDTDIP